MLVFTLTTTCIVTCSSSMGGAEGEIISEIGGAEVVLGLNGCNMWLVRSNYY